MSSPARVTSIDALRQLGAALVRFQEEASMALAQADTEALRTIDWLKGDRLAYWKAERVRREEQLRIARGELSRAQLMSSDLSPKSFIDQRKAVERAKRSVEEAIQKQAATQRWIRELTKEHMLYKGRVQPLATEITARIPAARHALDQMVNRLDEYTQIDAPAGGIDANTGDGHRAGGGVMGSGVGTRSGDPDRVRWSRRVPTRPQRQRTPLGEPPQRPQDWVNEDGSRREGVLLSEADPRLVEALRRLDERGGAMALDPVPAQDRVVLGAGWESASTLLLHRSERPALGDSGWYIGDASRDEPPVPLVAVRACDVLAALPEIEPLLSLPRGTAALIAGGRVLEIVTDAGERLDRADADGTRDRATEERA
jgi:hypothetical protein